MTKKQYMIAAVILMFVITGCNSYNSLQLSSTLGTTVNPTAKNIIENEPSANIFQFNDIVYHSASDIEWVQQAELTIGERVGMISRQYEEGARFEEEMATLLPIGTEIYEPNEKIGAILIVKVDGEELRYLGLIEG